MHAAARPCSTGCSRRTPSGFVGDSGSIAELRPGTRANGRWCCANSSTTVANWIATTGLPRGFLSLRWAYSTQPDAMPTTRVEKIRLDSIRAHLPPGTRSVASEERWERIRVRQSHVQRRYRHA